MSISRSSGLGLFGPLEGLRGLTRSGPTTEDYSPYRSGASGWPRSAGGTTRGTGGRGPVRRSHAPCSSRRRSRGRRQRRRRSPHGRLRQGARQQAARHPTATGPVAARGRAEVGRPLEGGRGGLLRARRPRRHRAEAGRTRRLLRRPRRRTAPGGAHPVRLRARHEDRDQPGTPAAAARRQGGPAGPLRRRDPEPARRLQRQGPLHPRRGPAFAGDHLRQDARAS